MFLHNKKYMKTLILANLITILILASITLNAQITIGSHLLPNSNSISDLKEHSSDRMH